MLIENDIYGDKWIEMKNDDRNSEGNKPRKKSKALSVFIKLVAAVLGLAVGFSLYWIYIFGGTFVAVPVVSREDYSPVDITVSGSATALWSYLSTNASNL